MARFECNSNRTTKFSKGMRYISVSKRMSLAPFAFNVPDEAHDVGFSYWCEYFR